MPFSFQQISVDSKATLTALGGSFFKLLDIAFIEGVGKYDYDPASTTSPDGDLVLIPDNITHPAAGRWIKDVHYDQQQADWDESDTDSPAYIKNKPIAGLIPSGAMMMWGAAAAPTGWLLCDGSAVSRSTYAGLFSVISTTFGMGDGSTTFNVPDFRQRFPLGKASSGTGATLGTTGGNIDHVHGSPLTTGTPSGTSGQLVGVINVASATHTHSVTVPADNPPYLTVNYIIKT